MRSALASSLPIVTIGLLIVTVAMLFGPWPSDPFISGAKTISHLDRLRGTIVGPSSVTVDEDAFKTTAWYARRVFDGVSLGLLVGGYAGVALAIWHNVTGALLALTLIGVMGILYAAVVGLYPGPILTLGGFSLVLIGAGLGWASLIADRGSDRT